LAIVATLSPRPIGPAAKASGPFLASKGHAHISKTVAWMMVSKLNIATGDVRWPIK
jgi:hypothetical protein